MPLEVLVVDDSPTVGSAIEWLLANNGYSVHISKDGLGAMNALSRFAPDIVILDVTMPNIDGHQLCQLIRSHSTYAYLPVIMLSGIDNQASKDRAVETGANAYITKPVNNQELLDAITSILPVKKGA